MKNIVLFFILLSLVGCITTKESELKREFWAEKLVSYQTSDDLLSDEERVFWENNRILSQSMNQTDLTNEKNLLKSDINIESKQIISTFFELFSSYLNYETDDFVKKSFQFLEKNRDNPLSIWITQRIISLVERDFISSKILKEIYTICDNQITKYLIFRFLNTNPEYMVNLKQQFFPISKWRMSGPYRFTINSDFTLFRKSEAIPINYIFKESFDLDFVEGGIFVPEIFDTVGLYLWSTTIEANDKTAENIDFYITGWGPFTIYIDGEPVLSTEINRSQLSNFNKISIPNSGKKHQIDILTLKLHSSPILIHSNIPLESTPINSKHLKNSYTNSPNQLLTIAEQFYKLPFSKDFQNLLLYEVFSELSENEDISLRFLKKIGRKNFYTEYLNALYFQKNNLISKNIKLEKIQSYLDESLKMNSNFLKSKLSYIVEFQLQNPTEGAKLLEDLNSKLKNPLFISNYLLSVYESSNQKDKILSLIRRLTEVKGGCELLLKYKKNLVKELDILSFDYCSREIQNSSKITDLKKELSQKEISQIVNFIKSNRFNPKSLYLFEMLELYSKNTQLELKNEIYKDFPMTSSYREITDEGVDIIQFMKKWEHKIFSKPLFFLDEFKKFIPLSNDIEKIKNYLNCNMKFNKDFPATKVLDEDFILIHTPYDYITLSYEIIQVHGKEGINRFATVPKGDYLVLKTVDSKTLKEYEPDFLAETSEFSLENLKDGDFIVKVTYNINRNSYSNSNVKMGNFSYNHINMNTFEAKWMMCKKEGTILELIPSLEFPLDSLKQFKIDDYDCSKIELSKLNGVKQETFMPQQIDLLIPTLRLQESLSWENIYKRYISAFQYSTENSYYTDFFINSFKKIETIDELKSFYYSITDKFQHQNNPYQSIIRTITENRGNLAYLIYNILNKMGIETDIIVSNTGDNFTFNTPSGEYYLYYLIRVKLKNEIFYLDFSSKWSQFNTLNPYLKGMKYLRIDKDGSLFSEKFPEFEQIQSQTNIKLKMLSEKDGELSLEIKLPSITSASIRNFLLQQSEEQSARAFQQYFIQLAGYVEDFFFEVENLKNPDFPLILKMGGKIDSIGRLDAGKIQIPNILEKEWGHGFYNQALLNQYATQEQRENPLITYFYNNLTNIEITLLDGYELDTFDSFDEKSSFGFYSRKLLKSENNLVKISQHYYIPMRLIQPSDYQNFKKFVSDVAKKRVKEIVLKQK